MVARSVADISRWVDSTYLSGLHLGQPRNYEDAVVPVYVYESGPLKIAVPESVACSLERDGGVVYRIR